MTAPPLAHRLAWSGSLPFLGCALLALTDLGWLDAVGGPLRAGNLYAVVILAFMAGSHWGQGLGNGPARSPWLPSNAVALAAFLAALLLPQGVQALVYAALFVALALFDHRQWRAGAIDRAYWSTRWQVSAVVVACLLVLALSG
jgi:hypothetical protein